MTLTTFNLIKQLTDFEPDSIVEIESGKLFVQKKNKEYVFRNDKFVMISDTTSY